jgi:hypothetical protein
LWEYDIATNEWFWIGGDNVQNSPSPSIFTKQGFPAARFSLLPPPSPSFLFIYYFFLIVFRGFAGYAASEGSLWLYGGYGSAYSGAVLPTSMFLSFFIFLCIFF